MREGGHGGGKLKRKDEQEKLTKKNAYSENLKAPAIKIY